MESTSDLGNSIALTDAIGWSISGIGWTAAYFLFMRSTKTHGAPCLPPLAYALNFAWEINLGLFTPPSRITQIIYTQWAVIDVALLWNQVKYGGMEAWEFLWMLILATGWEAACVKTAVSVAGAIGMAGGVGVGGLEEEVVGGAEGQARMLITFWLGYVCQTVISFWSLREVVRGRGKHLTYGMW